MGVKGSQFEHAETVTITIDGRVIAMLKNMIDPTVALERVVYKHPNARHPQIRKEKFTTMISWSEIWGTRIIIADTVIYEGERNDRENV